MKSVLDAPVKYLLPLYDVLDPAVEVDMNSLLGKRIRIEHNGDINCVVSGKKIKKVFGEGMSYEAFVTSPLATESIIRPELSRIHEGIALRDKEWEEAHHNQPHYVYLSLTSGIKVGVTRVTNIPSRWIDQGAVEAILLAETPYRQLAGLMEVELKEHISDRTNWRNMLKGVFTNEHDLLETKEMLLEELPEAYYDFIVDDDTITSIDYPVLQYPEKVSSLKLEKEPIIEKELVGIKGQYLLFGDNTVINLRSHAGFHIQIGLVE
ncbi:MAG: DUF2797 domain-containing protein [Flavobacteriales bacterium]|nr:DUF2797 domain-containing protein [Flavobacteriales bacterium]